MVTKPPLAAAMVFAVFLAIPVADDARKHTSLPTATLASTLKVVGAAAWWFGAGSRWFVSRARQVSHGAQLQEGGAGFTVPHKVGGESPPD
jgi:hypothetical protein